MQYTTDFLIFYQKVYINKSFKWLPTAKICDVMVMTIFISFANMN